MRGDPVSTVYVHSASVFSGSHTASLSLAQFCEGLTKLNPVEADFDLEAFLLLLDLILSLDTDLSAMVVQFQFQDGGIVRPIAVGYRSARRSCPNLLVYDNAAYHQYQSPLTEF